MAYTSKPEHANITRTAVNLLEFTLASYDHLCGLSRTPQSELDRHEKAIDAAFTQSASMFRDYLKWARDTLGAAGPKAPRIEILLRYCECGDDPTNAVARYSLVVRRGKKDAHRE